MRILRRHVLLLFLSLIWAGHAHPQELINGAGATFPYPIYVKGFETYTKTHSAVKINYQSIGSGGGIRQLSQGTVDFGATDEPMTDEEMKKFAVPPLHLPTVVGAVAVVYNIPGVSSGLNLTRDALVGIFLGKITHWNAPEIAAVNSGMKIPARQILIVHRSDGSGTTAILTDYLAKISGEWKSKVGFGKSVKWPAGLGGKGNEGVSGLIQKMPFSIGYVSLNYAVETHMAVAKVQNQSGAFVSPEIKSITAAAASFKVPADFRMMITDAKAPEAYSMSGFTWLLLPRTGLDSKKMTSFLGFLKWMLKEGQLLAPALHYAPLPRNLILLEEEALAQLH